MSIIDAGVARGIRLFNQGKYWEAHEALEEVWLKALGERKRFLQGLIQAAASLHHYVRRNQDGFGSLLSKGLDKLNSCQQIHEGIDVISLRRELQSWSEYARDSAAGRDCRRPPWPKIRRL